MQPNHQPQPNHLMTPESLQTWLAAKIGQELGISTDEVDIRAPLESYGLNSAQAMSLMSQAQKLLGFQLSPILLLHYPTIETLSERLAEEFDEVDAEVFEI